MIQQVDSAESQVDAVYSPTTNKLILSQLPIKEEFLSCAISKYGQTLRILHLGFCKISHPYLQLLTSATWPSLLQLTIRNCFLTDENLKQLAHLVAPNLQTLNLNKNNLAHLSIEYLSAGNWSKLRNLKLGNNPIGRGVHFFKKCKWPHLQILDLNNCQLGKEEMDSLVENQWEGLQELYLSNNDLQSAVDALQHARWPKLIHLSVETCNITEINWMSKMSVLFPELTNLILQRNSLNIKTVSRMKECNFGCLQELNVGSCKIGNLGLKYLARCEIPAISKLILWDNNITDAGVCFLTKLHAPQLQELDLWANKIADLGIDYLSRLESPKISQISVWQNDITNIGFLCVVLFAHRRMKIFIDENYVSEELKVYVGALVPNLDLRQ